MLYSNSFKINSFEIFSLFSKKNIANFRDFNLTTISSLDNPNDNSIFFIKTLNSDVEKKIKNVKNSIFITDKIIDSINNVFIQSSNPRLDFIKSVIHIYNTCDDNYNTDKFTTRNHNIIISNSSRISNSAKIYPNVYIGPNNIIGDNTIIYPNVSIIGNTTIGDNCVIGANSVIGNHGFGGERDKSGKIFMMPHLGGVILKNNVQIGASNTVVAGTINPTIIGEYTKLDDHVHFAHNCIAGKSCFITACTQLSGSVKIGDNVWIGPNTAFKQGLNISSGSTIGIGAVVTKNVNINQTVAGNPATDLKTIVKQRNFFKNI